ncbi:adenylate kinase 9 [Channa argus]|uniref:adenylate kinase 9 n=1 Tax=Channa argus TaxID=215402 RepID=UPI0035207FBB
MSKMDKVLPQGHAHADRFVDHLIEDEAERETLLAKPTCFLIVGGPGVGKSTLGKKLAESWKCILVDDTDLLNTHINNKTKQGIELLEILSEGKSIPEDMVLQLILARLNSPDVEHYGYVLSCLPLMSEEYLKVHEQIELIKNLKLTPDFIINIKCADKDLAHRLSGLKQHPETGQLYNMKVSKSAELYKKRKDSMDEEVEEELATEKELRKDAIDQMVWTPENLVRNALRRINMYKDTVLRPLENYIVDHNPLYLLELDGNNTPEELNLSVMSRLGSMAIKPVSIPVLLHQPEDEELPEDIDTEDLLRIMSSCEVVAPGFRWRRSRWGRTCPVALKEGNVIPGKPGFCVGFQGKLYILSSHEAYLKFIASPRWYLMPPMPRPPCRVAIIGPPKAGKTTLCKLLAQHYNTLVLDMEELVKPVLMKLEQERLEKIKGEPTQVDIEKIRMEQHEEEGSVTEDHPEVKAMVLSSLEEAKQLSISPLSLYAEALENYIKEAEEADTDNKVKTGWILDNFPSNFSQMDALKQADILPDMLFCLTNSDGNEVLKRLYKMNKENSDKAIKKTSQEEKSENENNEKVLVSEGLSNLETFVEQTNENSQQFDITSSAHPGISEKEALELPDYCEFGYPDGPEMNDYKLQLEQFMTEWEQMQSALTLTHSVLEIAKKCPEDLLQEMILEMEKPFQYISWEVSSVDQEEEAEDYEALAELERAEEGSSDNDAAEEENEQGDITSRRLLGDTHHFCPVALKIHNILWPCTDEIAAKYREKTYYFSNTEARDTFLQNPAQFVAQTEPLKPPALRIFSLGPRGSGKTTHGEWLAQQLGLFHIQFREQLQMLIMAKTKKRVPYQDEVEPSEMAREDLEVLIKEAMGEQEKTEDSSNSMDDMEKVELTAEEMAIKAYLSDGEPLTPVILNMLLTPYWKQEPYMSTGFILEGFPYHPDEVQYMLQQQLFPDVVIIMKVDVADVQKRLLPTYLENWREHHICHAAQLSLLRNLRMKNREAKIARRRDELMAEKGITTAKTKDEGDNEQDEGNEDADNTEHEIESILEQEFPLEENNEDIGNMETEATAASRIAMDIEERFVTDENNLVTLTDLLSEQNIPKVSINTSRKMRIVRYQLLRQIQPLLTNRESLFQRSKPISYSLAYKLLFSSYKFYSAFGCWDPIKQYEERDVIQPLQWPLSSTYPLIFHQYIYFFASKENRSTFMLNPLKYLRQSRPTPPLPIKIAITGPPKSGKTTVAQMFAKKYGLMSLSIGSAMRMVLNTRENTELAVKMKKHLSQGLVVPDELAIQCLEVAFMSSACRNHGYVLDGFPMTLKQAQLMDSHSIIPMIVVELELDTVEVLKRGLVEKLKPNKPHLLHDNSENLYIRNSCYKQEVEHVKKHFQKQYQNWILLDALKSKLWIWSQIRKEVSISMKCIHNYLERTRRSNAACINRLCITPKELHDRLGEFDQYCAVCLALYRHLMDCSENTALTYMAEYKRKYYKMCSEEHLEKFLTTPDEFVTPGCPHTLPQPHLLPKKLTEPQVKNKFPQQAEMKGFCPVSYLDGRQRYEALVRGNIEYAVEYRERIYIFETKQKQDKFLRSPDMYWDQKLPSKVPPLCAPISLTSLPTLGYLEQGVGVAVIKAMTAVGCLKPKYPFRSIERSAHFYVALYLKAFNPKSTDYTRQMYKKKLALFEENCALIPYLSSTMSGNYKSPCERPIDFEFKLKRFLALGDFQVADPTLAILVP